MISPYWYIRRTNTLKSHRFSHDIISYVVWLYRRFSLNHRDIEDLLAEGGITVSRESIRLWGIKLGKPILTLDRPKLSPDDIKKLKMAMDYNLAQ